MLHNNIEIIKKSCLLIIVFLISCMLISCEQTNSSKKSSSENIQVLESPPSDITPIVHKTKNGNENDESPKSSSLKSLELAKTNYGTSSLNKQVDKSNPSEEKQSGASSSWKIYIYHGYGYEVSYPLDYSPSVSGGHSVAANPEFGMRLSLYSKDNQPVVDIDAVKIDTFQNVETIIESKYREKMTLAGSFSINNEKHKIYSINDGDYYFVFFLNESYIFQLSSSSRELLTKIAGTFVFI